MGGRDIRQGKAEDPWGNEVPDKWNSKGFCKISGDYTLNCIKYLPTEFEFYRQQRVTRVLASGMVGTCFRKIIFGGVSFLD